MKCNYGEMISINYINHVVIMCLVAILYLSVCFEENIAISTGWKKSNNLAAIHESDYDESEEIWLENALRDIAYYLRNHKFNEWDRRFYENKPRSTGFYDAFPSPSLNSIHWMVLTNCHEDFLKCIIYLHSIVNTAPFTRNDDIATSLNKNTTSVSTTSLQSKNYECKNALSYADNTGLPFSGPKEKFYWRTSATYYMCWFTMKGTPALSMLGESCDNFASCLDVTFGSKNHDPRSNDRLSFACAMYSFCPDPCCPLKHIQRISDCYNNNNSPCYTENIDNTDISQMKCSFNRKDNQDLEQIMNNRWNVSCHCQKAGFKWDSQFGMCVDINECMTNQHTCDTNREDCLNLPGIYQCVCKWGFVYEKIKKKCVEKLILVNPTLDEPNKQLNFIEKVSSFFEHIIDV